MILVWLVVAGTGCIRSESVQCGEFVCAAGKTCAVPHMKCVSGDQATACAQLVDGDRCSADMTAGICDQGFCLPGCGDGTQAEEEQCDDANFASHDGCSSACLLEQPSWLEWHDAWTGRTGHSAVFVRHSDPNNDGVVVFGGIDPDGVSTTQWIRRSPANVAVESARQWTRFENITPPPRRHAAVAFDPVRRVAVLFGGQTSSATVPANETWELTEAGWSKQTTTGSPSSRYGAAMVWNNDCGCMVLFGGYGIAGTQLTELDDTWEYKVTGTTRTWTKVNITGPAARYHHGMAWEPTLSPGGRVIVFGGFKTGSGSLGDTWALQGGTWTQIITAGPSPRYGVAMAYFPLMPRRSIVLFGGTNLGDVHADTWELVGSTWTQLPGGATTPPGRFFATLTYDGTVNTLVLVGGTRRADSTPEEDVWDLFLNGEWQNFTPQLAPPARFASMAYDEAQHEIVLFSGYRGLGVPMFPDTWTWNDGWKRAPIEFADAPPGRMYHVTAYDPIRQRTVVFGGYATDGVTLLDDTHEYDAGAQTWSAYAGTAKPTPRAVGALAFDGTAIVLYGGVGTSSALSSTYEYTGTTWTQLSTSGPPAQAAPALAYDPDGSRAIMVDNRGDTWQLKDKTWTKLEVGNPPPPRTVASLVFHPQRRTLMLYGGVDNDGNFYSDLWELDLRTSPAAWTQVAVTGTVPPARQATGFAPHSPSRTLVLFGGLGGGGPLRDTWRFKYVSDTPDEVCDNSSDDDGDLHGDATDPDCAP